MQKKRSAAYALYMLKSVLRTVLAFIFTIGMTRGFALCLLTEREPSRPCLQCIPLLHLALKLSLSKRTKKAKNHSFNARNLFHNASNIFSQFLSIF